MMFKENKIHRQERFFVHKTHSVIYGYILDMISQEDDSEEQVSPNRYLPVVSIEGSPGRAEESSAPMRMAEPPSFLAQNYGAPEDLIGLRVRIDYVGTNWTRGICTIVDEGFPSEVGGGTSFQSTGFRFAPPGAIE